MTCEIYQRRVLALIDILGFSNHVRQIDGDSEKAKALLSIFSNLRDFIDTLPAVDIELRFISDTFIIIMPVGALPYPAWRDEVPSGILALELCKTIQSGLLSHGFLSRGSVVTGNMVLRQDILFGVALLNAHHLESRIARYPRILVDNSLFESDALPRKAAVVFKHLIETDRDGLQFVNIFDWEWEAEGIWIEHSGSLKAYALSSELSDAKDYEHMNKDLKFFYGIGPILVKMYDEAIANSEYRSKVEWIIDLYNRKMNAIFCRPRAKAFGLVAPENIPIKVDLTSENAFGLSIRYYPSDDRPPFWFASPSIASADHSSWLSMGMGPIAVIRPRPSRPLNRPWPRPPSAQWRRAPPRRPRSR